MRKMLRPGDSVIIDGIEFTTEEIKTALIDQCKYNKLSDFLQAQFSNGGVTSE